MWEETIFLNHQIGQVMYDGQSIWVRNGLAGLTKITN